MHALDYGSHPPHLPGPSSQPPPFRICAIPQRLLGLRLLDTNTRSTQVSKLVRRRAALMQWDLSDDEADLRVLPSETYDIGK